MEEIIAKSKKGKAERQTQRDDDLRATEELDATFTDLLQGASLATMLRAKGEETCVAHVLSLFELECAHDGDLLYCRFLGPKLARAPRQTKSCC